MLRKAIFTILAIGALLVSAVVALPFFLSAETVRSQIVKQVTAQTGLALRLDGNVAISTIPRIAVTAHSVGLAPSPGEDEILAAREVRFSMALLPLLQGQVELSGLTLVKPEFTIDAGGGAPSGSDSGVSDLPVTSAQLERLRIRRLGIEDGTLTVRSAVDEPPTVIENIDLTSALNGVDAPASVEAGFRFMAVDHRINMTLASVAELIDKGGTGANLDVEADAAKVSADGRLWRIEGGSFDGKIKVNVDGVDSLLTAYGLAPLNIASLTDATIESDLVADTSGFRLSGLKGQAGGAILAGDLSMIINGAKPEIGAVVSIDRIDFASFSTAGEARAGTGGADNDIDILALRGIEVDARVDIGRVSNGPVVLNDLSAVIAIHDGALDLSLLQAKGLGGGASGLVRLQPDAARGVRAAGQVRLNGIDLDQAANLAGISVPATGAVSTDLTFEATGANVDAMRNSLIFGGSAGLRDGTVTGLGLAEAFGGDAAADRLDAVAVDAKFTGLDGPVDLNGSVRWRGLPVAVVAKLDAGALAAGRPAAINATAKSSLANVGYAGNLSVSNLGVDGTVSLQTPSLTKLAQWAGQPLAVEQGLQAFAIRGRLSVKGDRISFADATISLDGSEGSGAIEADLSGAKPQITGRLAMQRIDVTPYMGGGGGNAGPSSTGRGWSDAPIDFSGLGAINAKLQLSAGELVWDKLKTGRTELDVELSASQLTADLKRFALYGGEGRGQVQLLAKSGIPTFTAGFDLAGLSLFPFLSDAIEFTRIEGAGNLKFSATGSGRSERQFTQTLAGSGSIDFRDGAIRGINIPKMVRGLTGGVLQGWQQAQNEKTDFSSLTASYTIDRGQLETSDLRLVGPLVRITGAGKANIPEQTIAFRIDPKVVASLQGQGNEADLAGLGVPVVIEGPWSQPRIYPDIKGILQNPEAALQRLQQSGGALFSATDALPKSAGDAAGSLIKELLGGSQQTSGQTVPVADSAPAPASPQVPADQPATESIDGIGQLIEQGSPEPAPEAGGQVQQPNDPAADLLKRLFGQ